MNSSEVLQLIQTLRTTGKKASHSEQKFLTQWSFRQCSTCREVLPLDHFYVSPAGKIESRCYCCEVKNKPLRNKKAC